ncbi:hypothetical protein [Tardiphaga sp. 813_E8_N1_3]|uniref:hypothetical protein n=1 Tax=Tardiphaga sp. 813_E8_N1_3 TaxID=3240760 RepID=UPI003F2455CC
MRILLLIGCSLFLTGCGSGAKDFGTTLGTAFDGLNTGLTAGANLEYQLYQDYKRKSEQLEFISLSTYSCGEPGTQTDKTIRSKTNVGIKQAQDQLIKTFHRLDLLIAYGKSVAEYRTSVTTFAATVDGVKSATGAVTKFTGPEAQVIGAAVISFAELAKVAYTESEATVLRALALDMKPELKKWVTSLKKNFVRVSKPQLEAFHYWNGCALERLYYLRDTYPTGPTKIDSRGNTMLRGVIKSTAVDFVAAYSDYIMERERFLAAMPNYNALLDAVIEANEKLIEVTPADIGPTLNSIGAVANALQGAKDAADKI